MVYTIQQRKPNTVSQVAATEVRLLKSTGEPRPSTPLKRDIVNTYRYFVKHGQVTKDDFDEIPESRTWGFVGYIILAILRDAVPEQIEEFRRGPSEPVCGIRLKANQDCVQ
ncbi:MAG: hypothetical protein KAW00_01850 [Dehalococcoidia bacterium]|nr:hypothetical protein [Dehalococcoidia bacterium]